MMPDFNLAVTTFRPTADPDQFARRIRWHEERVLGRDISAQELLLPETTIARVEQRHLLHTLNELALLEENWDGYGALPIDGETISNCKAAVVHSLRNAPAPDVAPNSNGTVSFEWSSANGYAHLEIGKTRFSFFVEPVVGDTILLEGEASKVPIEVGRLIAAIVHPSVRSVAAVTRLEYTAGNDGSKD